MANMSYCRFQNTYNDLIDCSVNLFDEDNSTITPFAADLNLTATSTFDSDGTLWLMNGRVEKPLNKFQNESWTSFDLAQAINFPEELGYTKICRHP